MLLKGVMRQNHLFARKSYDAIPPTRSSLVERVKGATYQAGLLSVVNNLLNVGLRLNDMADLQAVPLASHTRSCVPAIEH